MIDFEFEFQYSEESTPTLRKVSGNIPAGRCVVLCGCHADTDFFIRSQQDLQAVRRYMECFHPTKVSPPKQYNERFHPATKLLCWLVLTIGYIINQALAAFGSTIIPYAIAASAMADQAVTDGRQDTILDASKLLQSWVSVALVIGVIVAALIGALIGKRIVKEHLTV